MADEHKLLVDKDRGAKAQSLLDNELLKEAFEELERAYIREWKTNERRLGAEGREMLWQAVQVIGKVQAHLSQYVIDGNFAAAELDTLHPNHSD